MIALILAAATGLALLAPPGPEGVLLAALVTAATLGGTLLGSTFLASAAAFTLNVIIGSVASFALNKVVSALAGKPKAPKVQPFGVQASLRTGGDVPRSFILGTGVTAGSLVYANTWGQAGDTPNAYLTQVIALSDMPIKRVERLWVNGALMDFTGQGDPNDPAWGAAAGAVANEYIRAGVPYLWLKVLTGTQTAADPFLTGTVSSASRPWGSTRVGTGVAYAVVTIRFNRELFTGVPQYRFEVLGLPLYDPTLDSTAGGTGTHRFDNPATWDTNIESRQNPAIQLYNLLRGIRRGSDWVAGLQGVTAAQLPYARWADAIVACSNAGFRAGGEIAFDTELGDTVEALLASCEGRLTDNAGTSYALTIGAPGSAVASFTDDDIISTAEQSFTPFPGLADTVNGVIFTYPRPSQAYQVTQAPPLYDAALEAEDGGRRLPVTIEMPMVTSDEQAQRLAKAALAEARRARRHTLTLPPQFWPLEPGDVVSWTSARNGYTAKLFRVDGIVDLPDLDVLVDLTETDPADYDWDSETDYIPPVDGFLLPARPAAQATSITVSPHTLAVAGTDRRPAILLSWTGAPEDVIGLDWQVRLAATSALIGEGTAPGIAPGTSGSTILSTGLVPDTAYQVRGRWVPGSVRPVDWGSWLSVTTPAARFATADYADESVVLAKIAPAAMGQVLAQAIGAYAVNTSYVKLIEFNIPTAPRGGTVDLLGRVVEQVSGTTTGTQYSLLASWYPGNGVGNVELPLYFTADPSSLETAVKSHNTNVYAAIPAGFGGTVALWAKRDTGAVTFSSVALYAGIRLT